MGRFAWYRQLRRMGDRLRRILFGYDMEPTEILLGAASGLLGLWLLLPFDTFGSASSFAGMAAIAPETVWGLVMASLGTGRLCAIGCSARWLRSQFAFASGMIWLFIAVSIGVSNPVSTGLPLYSLLAVSSAWAYIRGRTDGDCPNH
jgi:hypothetical protein